jgi:hypothetical protein
LYKLLDLALFNDLELGLGFEAESAALEEVKEFLFSDGLPVECVVFPVGMRVVALADCQ